MPLQQKTLDFSRISGNIAFMAFLTMFDRAKRKMRHCKFYIAPMLAMLMSNVVFAQQLQFPQADGKRSFAQTPTAIRQAKYVRDSKEMMNIVGQVAPAISKSTVSIVSGTKEVALGMIVSPEGHILTKAGSLRGNVKVMIARQEHAAKLLGVHRGTDLAMLKIEAGDLPTVELVQPDELQHGSWVISFGPGNEPVAMGIFAGEPKQYGAALGVHLGDAEAQGVLIKNVIRGSAADQSDLWVNDVIRSIDDIDVTSIAHLKTMFDEKKPYDQIKLTILRGDNELTMPVELTESFFPPANFSMQTTTNSSTATKMRRFYFEHAIGHDSKLRSNQCGGPLVNLNGQIVGINVLSPYRIPNASIWPEGSSASLAMAIPIDKVIPIIELLKSGKLAPAAVNRDRIEFLNRTIIEMRDSLSDLSKQEDELTPRIEELQKSIQLQRDLQHLFDAVQKESRALQRKLERVETELKRLRGGFD